MTGQESESERRDRAMHQALRAAGFSDLSCFNPDVLRETFALTEAWRAAIAAQNSLSVQTPIRLDDAVPADNTRS